MREETDCSGLVNGEGVRSGMLSSLARKHPSDFENERRLRSALLANAPSPSGLGNVEPFQHRSRNLQKVAQAFAQN